MDPSAINVNVTVDDFDSVLSYADQSVWTTPDPSSSSFDAANSPWLMGTYHKTESVNASLSFNFTGPAIYIYGYSGPDYGFYEVQIDSYKETRNAYAATNASAPYLLYGASNLTYGVHQLALRNLGTINGNPGGNTFLFDFLKATMQAAPSGATISNVTYQENDPAVSYSGTWASNTSPAFSGGGSSFTNEDNASVTLSFQGSALYIFGDKKNDHRLYSVVLDDRPAEIYDGISGCGGAYGMTCEQQHPTLQYMVNNLDSSPHKVTVTNIAGVNGSFLDIDSFVAVVPSQYDVRSLTNNSQASPFVNSTGSSGTSTGTFTAASASGTHSTSPSAASNAYAISPLSLFTNPLFFLIFGVFWLLRPRL